MGNLQPYTKYKPSDNASLGDIPEDWEVRKLKFAVTINDETLPENTEKKLPFDYIDIESVREGKILERKKMIFETSPSRARRIVKNGDVIVSTVRTYLKAIVQINDLKDTTIVSTGFAVLRPSKLLREEFLNYCARSKDFIEKVVANSTGIGYPAITATKLSNIEILIPPITEQTAIANFLDYKTAKIDRFIRKKKQLIKLLNEQKAGIINDAVTKGINPNVAMKTSGIEWLGDIPENWDVRRTKVLFKLITDFAPKNNNEELLSVYTEIGVKPRKELIEKGNKASTTDGYWIVKKGDIIVNKLLAWMGASGVSNYDGVTSPAYDILRSKGEALPLYYHYIFRNPKTFREFKRHSRGIMEMRLRLYFSELGEIYMPLPSIQEQAAIVAHIEKETAIINKTIATIEQEIALVQEYRTALITEAVTGKIDVRSFQFANINYSFEEVDEELNMAAEEEVEYEKQDIE